MGLFLRNSFHAALLSVIVAIPALGAPSVYFGIDNTDLSGGGVPSNSNIAHASFAGAAGSLATQSFESLALGPVPGSFAIGGVTASFSSTATNTATNYNLIATGVNAFSTFPISGTKHLDSLSDQGTTYYTITFDKPVRALGFYVSDVSDWAGSPGPIPNLQLNLTQLSGGTSLDLSNGVNPTTIVNGNVSFFGVIDAANPITGFSISSPLNIPGADAIGIDLLQVAAVPEPSQAVLMLAGLACLFAFRRRLAGMAGFPGPAMTPRPY